MPGHQKGAAVATEPPAVPGQPADGVVGHEPAPGVVVVAMGLTLQVDRIPARWAAGGGGGNPVCQAVRVRDEAPDGIRRRADVLGLLKIRHGQYSSCSRNGTSILSPGPRNKRPPPALTAGPAVARRSGAAPGSSAGRP